MTFLKLGGFRVSAHNARGRSRRRRKSPIERANEISVFDVLFDFFGINHPRSGRSYKGYCPFAFEHPDGGLDKQFRTYPETNTAYCFEMHGQLTPVNLIAYRKELTHRRAAEFLLDHYGLSKPKDYRERWQRLIDARSTPSAVTNGQDLVEALTVFLKQHPAYERCQYDDGFLSTLNSCLEVLDQILERKPEEELIRAWYDIAKDTMVGILDKEETRAEHSS
jgi:hypothetical protein